MIPARAARVAVRTKPIRLTRSTSTPRARAAWGFPPAANTALPKGVRVRTTVAIPATARNQRAEAWKPPGSRPDSANIREDFPSYAMGKPPVTASSTPRQNIIEPRVTMKEGKRPRVTTQPFSAPMAAARARAATKARRWGHPARIIRAKAIEEAPSTDPTDRSNSPAIMSRVTPMATNPSSAAMVMIPARESRVRKYGAVTENPMKTARNPASAPTSG
jgi:hypothetical protein